MHKFFGLPEDEKHLVFQSVAEKSGMIPFAVEKDWWVVQTIALVFELEIGASLVFKGGTSLSKAWGCINRFSEDIDLAVDRAFFGFSDELSKSQRSKLRKTGSSYISEVFCHQVEAKFAERGFKGVEIRVVETTASDQDPRIVEVYYPSLIPSFGYIQPKVQLEIGCRSLREPFSIQPFSSLVDAHFEGYPFVQEQIWIPSVNPERTFLEKLFLLHEEFQKPKEKIRVDRLSRHLYDIHQLSRTEFAEKAIQDKALYATIVKHRYAFTRIGGIDYNLHQPQTIAPLPPEELMNDWAADYKVMREQMIYGESSDFQTMLSDLSQVVARINALNWKISPDFPFAQRAQK